MIFCIFIFSVLRRNINVSTITHWYTTVCKVESATTEVKQRLQISSSHDEQQRDVAEEERPVERTRQTAAVIGDEIAAGTQPVNRPELSSAAFDNQVISALINKAWVS